MNTIYLLKHKSEAFDKFKLFKAKLERQTGKKIGKLKSDRAGEYTSLEFSKFLSEHGIEVEQGPAKRPTANSVAKRFGPTLNRPHTNPTPTIWTPSLLMGGTRRLQLATNQLLSFKISIKSDPTPGFSRTLYWTQTSI